MGKEPTDTTSKADLVASRPEDLPTRLASVFWQAMKGALRSSLAEARLIEILSDGARYLESASG